MHLQSPRQLDSLRVRHQVGTVVRPWIFNLRCEQLYALVGLLHQLSVRVLGGRVLVEAFACLQEALERLLGVDLEGGVERPFNCSLGEVFGPKWAGADGVVEQLNV